MNKDQASSGKLSTKNQSGRSASETDKSKSKLARSIRDLKAIRRRESPSHAAVSMPSLSPPSYEMSMSLSSITSSGKSLVEVLDELEESLVDTPAEIKERMKAVSKSEMVLFDFDSQQKKLKSTPGKTAVDGNEHRQQGVMALKKGSERFHSTPNVRPKGSRNTLPGNLYKSSQHSPFQSSIQLKVSKGLDQFEELSGREGKNKRGKQNSTGAKGGDLNDLESDSSTVSISSNSSTGTVGKDSVKPSERKVKGVVAVELGASESGYMCSFSSSLQNQSIFPLDHWDEGMGSFKGPSCILLKPTGQFHSFGKRAATFYHDLDKEEAEKWLYVCNFWQQMFSSAEDDVEIVVLARNGQPVALVTVIGHILAHFKRLLKEEFANSSTEDDKFRNVNKLRWVIGMPGGPHQNIVNDIVLLAAEKVELTGNVFQSKRIFTVSRSFAAWLWTSQLEPQEKLVKSRALVSLYTSMPQTDRKGNRCMVIHCGGEFLYISVLEISDDFEKKEILFSQEQGIGSQGVTVTFLELLTDIFGSDFLCEYRERHPLGYEDLIDAFESRKQAAKSALHETAWHQNIVLPFDFILFHKKEKGFSVETSLRRYGDQEIFWSNQGMIRITATRLRALFEPTLARIREAIKMALRDVSDIATLYIVGGFAESHLVQEEMLDCFGRHLEVVIPRLPSLAVLKGLLRYGFFRTNTGKSKTPESCHYSYGVAVLRKFNEFSHPAEKKIHHSGVDWCVDIFDPLIRVKHIFDQPHTVTRTYSPAKTGQDVLTMNLYRSPDPHIRFVTEAEKCGRLKFKTGIYKAEKKIIQATFTFTADGIKVVAADSEKGVDVPCRIQFDPPYVFE